MRRASFCPLQSRMVQAVAILSALHLLSEGILPAAEGTGEPYGISRSVVEAADRAHDAPDLKKTPGLSSEFDQRPVPALSQIAATPSSDPFMGGLGNGVASMPSCNNGLGEIRYEKIPDVRLAPTSLDTDVIRLNDTPVAVLFACQDRCLKDQTAQQEYSLECGSLDFIPGTRISSYSDSIEFTESKCLLSRPLSLAPKYNKEKNYIHFREVCYSATQMKEECPSRMYVMERHLKKSFMPRDAREVEAFTLEECQDKCLDQYAVDPLNATSICRAGSWDEIRRKCYLSSYTRRTHPAIFKDDPNMDYFENTCLTGERRCPRNKLIYLMEKDRELGGSYDTLVHRDISLEDCKQKCIESASIFCRSLEYDERSRTCVLSDEDSVSKKDEMIPSTSDKLQYYELMCIDGENIQGEYRFEDTETQPLKQRNTIEAITAFELTKNRVLELRNGFQNTGGRELNRVRLIDCLDSCLEEWSFVCRSLMYSVRYENCILSEYDKLNGKLVYDSEYDYYENLVEGKMLVRNHQTGLDGQTGVGLDTFRGSRPDGSEVRPGAFRPVKTEFRDENFRGAFSGTGGSFGGHGVPLPTLDEQRGTHLGSGAGFHDSGNGFQETRFGGAGTSFTSHDNRLGFGGFGTSGTGSGSRFGTPDNRLGTPDTRFNGFTRFESGGTRFHSGGERFGSRGSGAGEGSTRFGTSGGTRFGSSDRTRFGASSGTRFSSSDGARFGTSGGTRFGESGGTRFGESGGTRFSVSNDVRGGDSRFRPDGDRPFVSGGIPLSFDSQRDEKDQFGTSGSDFRTGGFVGSGPTRGGGLGSRNSLQDTERNIEVSQQCYEDGSMEFTLRTDEPFRGRIYAYGYYDRCFFRGGGSTTNVLKLTSPRGFPDCGTLRYGDTTTNIVVVQFSDNVQTALDKRYNLTCTIYGPGEAVVTSGYIGAGSGAPIPIEYLPAENQLESRVRLQILYDGRPTTTVAVGDPLTFRLESISGRNLVSDIFATSVVAKDPYSGRSIELIDSRGCPNDIYIFPALNRARNGDGLETRFSAFKIPESNFLVFEATVRPCKEECQPALCSLHSGREQVPSYGRRRRQADTNDTLATWHSEDDPPFSQHEDDLEEDAETELVHGIYEVYLSRDEIPETSYESHTLIDEVCLRSYELHGLVVALTITLICLFAAVATLFYYFRKQRNQLHLKNISADSGNPHQHQDGGKKYPNFPGSHPRSIPQPARQVYFPACESEALNEGPKRFQDPSEPIYTDPTLFERARSLRSKFSSSSCLEGEA